MNIEETKEAIAVMQAFVDGKTIQYTHLWPVQWNDFVGGDKPSWGWISFQYRVKPEPKEIWVNEYKPHGFSYDTKDAAVDRASRDAIRTAVRYREVIEE